MMRFGNNLKQSEYKLFLLVASLSVAKSEVL